MDHLLEPYKPILGTFQYLKAVDGKALLEDEFNRLFSQEEAFQRYGRYLKKGEAGCTLSHRKCFQQLIDSDEQVAFLMEDDILFWVKAEELGHILKQLEGMMNTSHPTVILLFGEYWWTRSRKIDDTYRLQSVYEAISTQGYLINRSAAKLLLRKKASNIADDWGYIISQGVKVKALYPHVIDQEWSSFETTVSMDGYGSLVRKNLKWYRAVYSYWRGAIKRFLKAIGHFDPHRLPEGTPDWAIKFGI